MDDATKRSLDYLEVTREPYPFTAWQDFRIFTKIVSGPAIFVASLLALLVWLVAVLLY